MSRTRDIARRYGFDALVVAAALEAALEVALRDDALRAPRTALWLAAPAAAAIVLPLLWRRRFPFAAPAMVWVLASALSFVDGRLVVFAWGVLAAGLVAAFLLGSNRDARRSWLGLAVVLGSASIVAYHDPNGGPRDFFFLPMQFAIAWLAGFALRERSAEVEAAEEHAARAEREREEGARRAVFEERVRIARELHDVVAHHVSMMGVQAGAARMVIDRDPAKAREALSAIETSSRQAVVELHRLLGFLRQEGDRDDLNAQPGLAQLPRLTASMSTSAEVELRIDGEARPLPSLIEVSAYRIVQEALTNTVKHSTATRADVHLTYGHDGLEVEVVDNGRPATAASSAPGGLGLIGMRERAALHDGQFSAGPCDGGGYAVRVFLPTPAGSP